MQIKRYVVGNMGNNNYLVWDEESLEACLIDATGNYRPIVEDAMKMNLNLKYVILTHGHFDHTGGVKFYAQEFPDSKLVACKKEAKMLYDRKLSFGPGGLVADLEVKDGDELKLGNLVLKFIETPGHTSGGMCILAEKTLFSGDTLFYTSVGRSDFPTGDGDTLRESIINKLYVLPDDTRVLPGHDRETTIGFEKENNFFV